MSLTFKKYERTSTGELTNIGSLSKLAGKGAKLAFIPSNLRNLKKRVAVVVEKPDGTSAVVACAQSVSDTVRKALETMSKQKVLGALAKMSILENEDEMLFISPEGGALEFFTVDSLKSETVVYDELVGF